jgi:hypothetical protein
MSVKKVVIVGMLAALWVPFVLLTDMYPFFRFGMFAEPVRASIQMEQFAVGYVAVDRRQQVLSPEQLGITSLAYLMRNYYYRNQSLTFLKHIHAIYPERHVVKQWQLLRIASPAGVFQPDTVVVATYVIPAAP